MCASEEEKDAREADADAPPGIVTEHHDDREVGQGKQDEEASGGFEKAVVQGKGETGDRLPNGEKKRGRDDQLGGQDHETRRTDPRNVPQAGRGDGLQ